MEQLDMALERLEDTSNLSQGASKMNEFAVEMQDVVATPHPRRHPRGRESCDNADQGQRILLAVGAIRLREDHLSAYDRRV
jgi:hypothetical protein